MATFNNEQHMNNIFREFGNIEKFHKKFKQEFAESLMKIIANYHKEIIESTKLNTIIYAYAGHLLDVIESVIEKDKKYSNYRLMIELHRMKKVLGKINHPKSEYHFETEIEKNVKSITVNYYPAIIDFTSNGFRLLETNLQLFTRDFLSDFYFDLKKNSKYQA